MSANALTPSTLLAAPDKAVGGASWTNAIRAEWTKFWSVRSTYWSLLALFTLTIGLSALISAATVSSSTEIQGTEDSTVVSLAGLDIGQLVIVVLGVMVIGSEYSTRSIRTSLVAMPHRLRFLGAKALVLVSVALLASMVTAFTSFFIGQAILSADNANVALGDPGVLRAVIGGGLYLAGSAMFGFALGTLLRSTAGGISFAIAGLVVLPQLSRMLPGSWGATIQKFFTSNAGQEIVRVVDTGGDNLGPWMGYLVFTVWWVVPLALAAVLMLRRDV